MGKLIICLVCSVYVTWFANSFTLSKTGRDCLHGTVSGSDIERISSCLSEDIIHIKRGIRCTYLHIFKMTVCGYVSRNASFICHPGGNSFPVCPSPSPEPQTYSPINTSQQSDVSLPTSDLPFVSILETTTIDQLTELPSTLLSTDLTTQSETLETISTSCTPCQPCPSCTTPLSVVTTASSLMRIYHWFEVIEDN